jgi:uncharacterized protein (TIGR02147 family)
LSGCRAVLAVYDDRKNEWGPAMKDAQNKKTVFDFTEVQGFLEYALSSESLGRGSRVKLAEELGVQSSFVSLVTTGRTSLSLEQGIKCARFLKLDEEETRFLINLIQVERAGSQALKGYFTQEQKRLLSRRSKIKNRIQVNESIGIEDQQTYYSEVNYILIHIMSVLPRYSEVTRIAQSLGVSVAVVKTHLDFLESRGFIEKSEKGSYRIGKARIHLPLGSPNLPNHHANLRNHAVHALGAHQSHHLHFSSVYGLSKSTYKEIRELLLQSIEDTEGKLKKSKPEVIGILNMDWYTLE